MSEQPPPPPPEPPHAPPPGQVPPQPPGAPPPGWGPGGPAGGPPRRPKTRLIVALAVIAVLVVGVGVVLLARGGDGRSEEEQAYVDAVADSGAEESEELGFSAEETRCYAGAIVDAIGVDRLREHATPEEIRERGGEGSFDALELDRGQAETLYDSASDCIDFRRVLVDSARAEGMSEAQADCFEEALTEDLVRDFMLATFAEGAESDEATEAVERIEEAAAPCENAG